MWITKEQVYSAWRPENSAWSAWVKPVLFSFVQNQEITSSGGLVQDWPVPLDRNAALLVDLEGAQGVWAGITLARCGYRPVPVYNACPSPGYDAQPALLPSFLRRPSTVDVDAILRALTEHAPVLRQQALPGNSPPAFLINSRRRGSPPADQMFDNRSFIAVSDFPSASVFNERGIRSVVVIRANRKIAMDLHAVLLNWQSSGITIKFQEPYKDWGPAVMRIRRAPLRWLFHRFAVLVGYPSHTSGCFGEIHHTSG